MYPLVCFYAFANHPQLCPSPCHCMLNMAMSDAYQTKDLSNVSHVCVAMPFLWCCLSNSFYWMVLVFWCNTCFAFEQFKPLASLHIKGVSRSCDFGPLHTSVVADWGMHFSLISPFWSLNSIFCWTMWCSKFKAHIRFWKGRVHRCNISSELIQATKMKTHISTLTADSLLLSWHIDAWCPPCIEHVLAIILLLLYFPGFPLFEILLTVEASFSSEIYFFIV